MRAAIGGSLVLALTILALTLLFAASVASRMHVGSLPPRANTPGDACTIDGQCWCRSFNGAEFIPNQYDPGRCEEGKCAPCIYE